MKRNLNQSLKQQRKTPPNIDIKTGRTRRSSRTSPEYNPNDFVWTMIGSDELVFNIIDDESTFDIPTSDE